MTSPREVSSPQNPLIKEASLLLTKGRVRRERNRCVIEGLREVERAISSGLMIDTLFYRSQLLSEQEVDRLFLHASETCLSSLPTRIHCSENAFQRIAYRVNVPNVVAIAHRPDCSRLLSLSNQDQPDLILLLEGIEKPGNLGAILRTADGMGVTGVILIDCPAELDHPNTIRNSLGAAFSMSVTVMSIDQTLAFLDQYQLPLYVSHLHAEALPPHQLPLHNSCALLLGAEATGVRPQWLHRPLSQATVIPMSHDRVIDSFNVSVAAAMFMYEARRQRF